MSTDPRVLQAAIDWHLRQRDPAFADWEGFSQWLEADACHAATYADIAARDADLAERLADTPRPEAPTIQDNEPVRPGRFGRGWGIGLGGIAASVAAALLFVQLGQDRELYDVTTRPGVQQVVTLAGGTRVELNGDTRLTLDRGDPRFAELHHGEAVFAVVHDETRPFRVVVDGAELVDLGTRFTVLRDDRSTEVAVSEGLVLYNPGREAIQLAAGRMLVARDDDPTIRVTDIEPSSVGAFREGRLIYDNAPLSEVAADLSRTVGVTVRADPAIAARPVTAVIQLSGNREQLAGDLEKLLDINVRRNDGDWILTSR